MPVEPYYVPEVWRRPEDFQAVAFHTRLDEVKEMIQMRQKYFRKVKLNLINMNNCKALIIVILLLTATVLLMQSALAREESIGSANESLTTSSNKTELISFVESALAYARVVGKDRALEEFSNNTSSFVSKDLYIYAYDFNGTCLAHPFKPDWIGKNKLDVTDSNGVPSLRNTLNAAKEGKGFTYFIFPNPAHDNRDEFKIAYAMKVDDNWFLGSGIYISCS
ncbi:MAG: cache domain-containing protein [Methanothrix sp.]|nr:cache domain-containing protein [Methanothrix sp.]